jgi:hypothetical protein
MSPTIQKKFIVEFQFQELLHERTKILRYITLPMLFPLPCVGAFGAFWEKPVALFL